MDFWANKSEEYKFKMIDVYKDQIEALELVVPSFKIANATIHFDEYSPHLHIVGIPIKDGLKNGMDKQVGKSAIFTKESLRNIQDKMREYCIISFNNIYETNYTIKMKEEGRNFDYDITDMTNYREVKKQK